MAAANKAQVVRLRDTTTSALAEVVQGIHELADTVLKSAVGVSNELDGEPQDWIVSGLDRPAIRNWLCRDLDVSTIEWCPWEVSLTGSGPWQSDEFAAFVEGLGLQPVEPNEHGATCIVVGVEDWDRASLDAQIYDRTAEELLVLPQELFVGGLIRNEHPLNSLDPAVLADLATEHPALSYLIGRGFRWPGADLVSGVRTWTMTPALASESPLHAAGYQAQQGGLDAGERQAVLRQFFFAVSARGLDTRDERERWGTPRSAQRLYSMATFLAWLVRFRGPDVPIAAAKWRTDLDYLRRTLYRPMMSFQWPSSAPGRLKHDRKTVPARTTLNPATPWPYK